MTYEKQAESMLRAAQVVTEVARNIDPEYVRDQEENFTIRNLEQVWAHATDKARMAVIISNATNGEIVDHMNNSKLDRFRTMVKMTLDNSGYFDEAVTDDNVLSKLKTFVAAYKIEREEKATLKDVAEWINDREREYGIAPSPEYTLEVRLNDILDESSLNGPGMERIRSDVHIAENFTDADLDALADRLMDRWVQKITEDYKKLEPGDIRTIPATGPVGGPGGNGTIWNVTIQPTLSPEDYQAVIRMAEDGRKKILAPTDAYAHGSEEEIDQTAPEESTDLNISTGEWRARKLKTYLERESITVDQFCDRNQIPSGPAHIVYSGTWNSAMSIGLAAKFAAVCGGMVSEWLDGMEIAEPERMGKKLGFMADEG